MVIIKSYTDLEQSKKLAKILPLESADMSWVSCDDGKQKYYQAENRKIVLDYEKKHWIPCWSLATLLSIIPKYIKDYNVLRIDINKSEFAIWYDEFGCGANKDLPDIARESAVNACYEMIIHLNELKLL